MSEPRDAWLCRVAAEIGTPAYVYFTDAISARIEALRSAFEGRFDLSYAAKSNPNPQLLAWLAQRVETIDVSSIGELRLAVSAGWQAGRASFTGPAKRDAELREAIEAGVGELVIELLREAKSASRIAAALGRTQDILVRVAPSRVPKGFGDQMAGRPSAFGLDVETIDDDLPVILALPHLRLIGFHIYSGTQCLKPEPICENYRGFLASFEDLCGRYDITPHRLIFGSGLGIPYHAGDVPLDLAAVAAGIAPDLDAFRAQPRFAGARLTLELGRYLVGEAGYFLTRVVSVKELRGSRIGICDGGMNNHLPASGHFGMVIHRNYPMHKVNTESVESALEKIDLVGPLCTSIDRLANGVMLPRLEEGDLVAIHSSGAYGLTASPIHFISHPHPSEVMIDDGVLVDATRSFGDPGPQASTSPPRLRLA